MAQGSRIWRRSPRRIADTHYVVTGSKLWTTGAHIANRMFGLVRTAHDTKPQYGITFLLVDMARSRHLGQADPVGRPRIQ